MERRRRHLPGPGGDCVHTLAQQQVSFKENATSVKRMAQLTAEIHLSPSLLRNIAVRQQLAT